MFGRHIWKNIRSQDSGFLNACQATEGIVWPEKSVQQGMKLKCKMFTYIFYCQISGKLSAAISVSERWSLQYQTH
jgi:hypothetical protein